LTHAAAGVAARRCRSCASDRKLSHSIPRVLNKNQRTGLQISKPLIEDHREALVHGFRSFIRQSKDDHARLIQDAKRENVAKVEIERDDDAAIRARSIDKDNVWSSLESKSSDVSRFVTKLRQELDRLWRDPSIRQKTHASGSECVQLVLSQGGCVPEGLADVLFLEVGQFLHDLRRSHAVGNEVDNMGDGNPKAAHSGSAGQDFWCLRDAVEGACHRFSPSHSSPSSPRVG
jgi:hypothetical protein